MNRVIKAGMLGLAGWTVVTAAVAAGPEAVVKGDRVNLRARPQLTAEVVAQANEGDRLITRAISNGWVEVAVPAAVDVWVHRDFVKEGRAVAKLNVRGGAGINFNTLATLGKGEAVQVRGEFGEWLKIAPPAAASLWVNEELVEVVRPKPVPPPVVAPKPPPVVARPPVPPTPPEPAAVPPPVPPAAPSAVPYVPEDVRLAPVNNQGRPVVREGRLRAVLLALNRPSRYHLVREQGNQQEIICYLRGNEAQLRNLEERRMRIRGREYFVQGARYPMIVVDEIALLGDQ